MAYKRKPKNKQDLPLKPKKKPVPRKGAAPKTRNSGTMSEGEFWAFIKNALRNKSRFWKPIQETKLKARRAYKGRNKRQKFEYQCYKCHEWFPDKEVEVDHIIPVGSLRSAEDLVGVVQRLFCEVDMLKVICKPCHLEKTKGERSERLTARRNTKTAERA